MKEREGQTWKKDEGVANKVEKEKPRKNHKKLASLAFGHFFKVFPFPLYWSSLPPFFQVRSSLSSLILPLPLYASLISCTIFSPCCPGPAPGTWYGMILERFYPLPLFLSLFILHLFLVWSSALAVQTLCLAHDVELFLRGSAITPSLQTQSSVQVVSKYLPREWGQES